MSESVVTIKLKGDQYRELCRELEYHEMYVKNDYDRIAVGTEKNKLRERLVRFQTLRNLI